MIIIAALRLLTIAYAKILRRPICLSDISDVDGIVSASLFKMKFPQGIVVLAGPREAAKSPILRLPTWDFVADLPCPGKVRVRADHHKTNKPCAEREYYDDKAPCAALLALRALGLEESSLAKKLVGLSIETDTANIKSSEARALDSAIKGAPYWGKLYLVERLSREGLNCLNDERVKGWMDRAEAAKRWTEYVSTLIPVERTTIVVFRKDIRIFYRYLSILLERRGAEFTSLIVPRGLFSIRIYLGAQPTSPYDASILALKYGGGGHKVAAGALIQCAFRERVIRRILRDLKEYLGTSTMKYLEVLGSHENIEVVTRTLSD